jgi:hypothetical protein
MQASPGDQIMVRGHHVGDADRHGEVIEVRGGAGQPPYIVRWSDGHEALFVPSSDAIIETQPAAGTGTTGASASGGDIKTAQR